MKIEDLKVRVDELLSLGQQVLSTQKNGSGQFVTASVNSSLFNQFRSSALSFLQSVFGENHPYYREFNTSISRSIPSHTSNGIGIIKAVKLEIDGGWLVTIRGLISAEIFSDFLEMAEHLLQEGYKDPSAVMIGSVLEEHLRQLCSRHGVAIEVEKGGKLIPKRTDLLNAELANAAIYNKLDQKSITSWLDLRNKAAHGKYSEYTEQQVTLMYQGVLNFISRTT